jgi:flagellar motor protein MotB
MSAPRRLLIAAVRLPVMLIGDGPSGRIRIGGPIASSDSDEGRTRNRRIEFQLQGKEPSCLI